jgi:hypothetical protein
MRKSPILRSPSIRQPRMSNAIKPHPPRECPQLQVQTIPTTASTSSIQLRWKNTAQPPRLYWFFEDDSASLSKNSGIITEWLFLLLIELDIPTPPGVKWTGHFLRRGGASAAHVIGVSITVIMAWGLWKSLASALLYIDVSVRPSSEALFFFGHLLARFNLPQAPRVRQATPTDVRSSIDLSDAFHTLLEFDD